MEFEDITTNFLRNTWFEYSVLIFTIVFIVSNVQIPVLTMLVDTFFGKLFIIFVIIYLLSEEHYRLSIALGLILINVLSSIRERDDLMSLRNKVRKSPVEKSKEQKKISGPTKKCSRENRTVTKEEREPLGYQ